MRSLKKDGCRWHALVGYLQNVIDRKVNSKVHDRTVPLLTAQEILNCCWLLRDIFGYAGSLQVNLPVWREWRTDTTVALARRMYESGNFELMPILADALQDVGCDNVNILHHCRGTESRPRKGAGLADNFGQHARGCWVVDLVLGKEHLSRSALSHRPTT